MKVRVTLMTENDKEIPEDLSREEFEKVCMVGWQMMAVFLQSMSGGDTIEVEKCEVIKEEEE